MNKRRQKTGLPPGSVVFTGNQKVDKVQLHYLKYDEGSAEEKTLDNHGQVVFYHSLEEQVDWYDIRGLHDTALIEQIGGAFKVHSLVLEDVSDTYQRPKFEEFERGIFIIVKALTFNPKSKKISREHVALYFRKGLVITFQETESDLFEAVRKRIKNGHGKVRQRGADYLVYALLDVLVDNYFIVLDTVGEELESLEERMLVDQDATHKAEMHLLKKELLSMRKAIAPLREAIGRFAKSESLFIEESTSLFIRDLYDHTIQVMDVVESFRDLLNGLQDLFISEVSLKMNQVMQVLTLVATIFIPLTFLAGIYGMNFENMPELKWEHGYFGLLALMAIIFFGLLILFKRKKWM